VYNVVMKNTSIRLQYLKDKLQLMTGERISDQLLSTNCGLSVTGIGKIRRGETKGIDLETIDELKKAFAALGMPITAGQLFSDYEEE